MKRLIAIALLPAGSGTTGSDVVAPSATPAPVATPSPSPAVVLAPTPDGPTEEATVTRVIDGDTIEVALDGALFTVRYIGIDTPETKAPNTAVEFMGPQAAAAN